MPNKKTFQNYGLRRLENLNDVADRKESLSNLLNDLVSGADQFSADDLNALNGLSNTGITRGDFRKISEVAVDATTLNNEGQLVISNVRPQITIRNQIETINSITGEAPVLSGGDGLRGEFWRVEKLSSQLSKNSTGEDVFTTAEPDIEKDPFWDFGRFDFTNVVDETLGGSEGGIQWSGFYNPIITGRVVFIINTSGYLMLELENDAGELEVVKSIYSSTIPISPIADATASTEIEISPEDYRHIANGGVFDPGGTNETTITNSYYDRFSDQYFMRLATPVTVTTGETFDVGYPSIGLDTYSFAYVYTNLEQYVPRAMRLTFWFTAAGGNEKQTKTLTVRQRQNEDSTRWVTFRNLYSTYDENDASGKFRDFFKNRVPVYGGTIGEPTVTSSTDYSQLFTASPLFVGYEPPKIFSDVVNAEYQYSASVGSKSLSTSGTSPLTSDIEVGNYILSQFTEAGAQVTQISRDQFVLSSSPATDDGNGSMWFVDHRGAVGHYVATSSGNAVTVSSTEDIKAGMIVITRTNTDYVFVTSVIDSTTFETSVDLGLATADDLLVYTDKGLENQSLGNFCVGVYGKEISGGTGTVVVTGGTELPLNNVTDLEVGMVVQSTGYIPDSTTVTSVDAGTNSVIISNAVTADMISGITVVFAPAGTTLNKEQCVIPLNTAPPFSGTDTGLSTTGNLTLQTPGAELRAVGLEIQNASTSTVASGASYNTTVQITVNGVAYNILSSS